MPLVARPVPRQAVGLDLKQFTPILGEEPRCRRRRSPRQLKLDLLGANGSEALLCGRERRSFLAYRVPSRAGSGPPVADTCTYKPLWGFKLDRENHFVDWRSVELWQV